MSTSLTKTNELLEKLNSKSKKAIISLIDLETERNMQAVIEQLKSFESKMNSRFDKIESNSKSKFDNIESKFDSKFDNVQSKLSTLYWLLTFLVTITTVFAGLKIFN